MIKQGTSCVWSDLRCILKGKGTGKRATIEEINEAIAEGGAEAGMAGITRGKNDARKGLQAFIALLSGKD